MEKVTKTRNGTAESAQGTPTHLCMAHGATPMQTFCAREEVCSLIQLETDEKQTTRSILAIF